MGTRAAGLIVATTTELEGRPVREYLGIVSGEAATTIAFATGRTAGGVRTTRAWLTLIERRVSATRDQAVAAMVEHALELGATAIIGVDVTCSNVHRSGGGDLIIITVSGTAVTV